MDEAITSYIKKKNRIFSYTEIEEINVKPENYINHELYYTRRQRLHGERKNVRSRTLTVNKSGGKNNFSYNKLHPLMPSCPHYQP